MKLGRQVAIAAAVGSTFTLLDRMHWKQGALEYGKPGLLAGQPLWVLPLFASAAVALMFAHRWLVGLRLGHAPRGGIGTAALQTGIFAFAYACTAWFHTHPWMLTAALVLAFVPVAARDRYPGFASLTVVAVVVGPLVECAISSTGAFHYTHADLGSIPLWLPALYLWAAWCGAGLDRWLGAGPERQDS